MFKFEMLFLFFFFFCIPYAHHKCLVYTCRYESPEVALNCGMMLRECLRHEPLARTVLFSEEFFCFFHYVELSTFDIASDAFASFKVHSPISLLFLYWERLLTLCSFPLPLQDLLTKHKVMCAEFLDNNYDRVRYECL